MSDRSRGQLFLFKTPSRLGVTSARGGAGRSSPSVGRGRCGCAGLELDSSSAVTLPRVSPIPADRVLILRVVRSPLDLFELPYSFAQLRPVAADAFLREAGERGVRLHDADLEALHRSGILIPLLRIAKDTRGIAALWKQNPRNARHVARWAGTSRYDLEQARAEGRLNDVASERFIPRSARAGTLDNERYEASSYLYSPHQVIMLPLAKEASRSLSHSLNGRQHRARFPANARQWIPKWQERGQRLRVIVVGLSALDPVYYPDVRGRLSLDSRFDLNDYFQWRRRLPLTALLKWMGVPADWLKESAAFLLRSADGIDPLREWVDLIAEVEPEKWDRLRGDARNAVDLRIAAEMLLRYYEDLAHGRRAKSLPTTPGRFRSQLDGRLKRRRSLDETLTEYGLSPHPRLVLVVEGETELLVLPRVMEHFGVRREDDFISVQMAGGTGRDLSSLIAYAVAPRVSREEDRRYLNLRRPPTRIFVVFDAERPVDTAAAREKRRRIWVDWIMFAMPADVRDDPLRAALVRDQIDRLVELRTWNRRGESFEFAHFTDRQLAVAIDRIDWRTRKPSLAKRVELVGSARRGCEKLDNLIFGSKLDLADVLWPTLEAKIRRATRQNAPERVPIVSVLQRALDLAYELPRRHLVIDVSPPA